MSSKNDREDIREDAESIFVERSSAKRKINNSYENYPQPLWERMTGEDSFLAKYWMEIGKWYLALIIGILLLEIWTEKTVLPAGFDYGMFLFAHLALVINIGITCATILKIGLLMEEWEHYGFFIIPLLIMISTSFWWFFYEFWIKGIFGIAGSNFS